MSDGEPSGSDYELRMAKQRIQVLQKRENLIVIPIGIGQYADTRMLSDLAMGEEVTNIFGVDFEKLFQKLSDAIDDTSELMGGTAARPDIHNRMERDDFEDGLNRSDT